MMLIVKVALRNLVERNRIHDVYQLDYGLLIDFITYLTKFSLQAPSSSSGTFHQLNL